MTQFDFLSDITEQTTTRFVTFITPALNRFDLAITGTERFYGKKLVTDLQRNITGVIGPDDLREAGVLESIFQLEEDEADELRHFLSQVVEDIRPMDD